MISEQIESSTTATAWVRLLIQEPGLLNQHHYLRVGRSSFVSLRQDSASTTVLDRVS